MKNLMLAMTLFISLVSAQEFNQKNLRIIQVQPFVEGPTKFQVKYINPSNLFPQDSIFEEKRNVYNSARNDNFNRSSTFLWKNQNPRDLVFFTTVLDLYTDPYFEYTYFDITPLEKPVFYITENVFEPGRKIVYCQGVKQASYKDSVNVMVTIFNPDGSQSLTNFKFHQMVVKNTTFKVSSGFQGSAKYFKVDMYQDDVFSKNVYNWNSANAAMMVATGLVKAHRNLSRITLKDAQEFNIMGQKINFNGWKR